MTIVVSNKWWWKIMIYVFMKEEMITTRLGVERGHPYVWIRKKQSGDSRGVYKEFQKEVNKVTKTEHIVTKCYVRNR